MNFPRIIFHGLAVIFTVALAGAFTPARSQNAQSNATPTEATPITVRALAKQPGEVSLYEVSFTTKDSLGRRAEIVLEFPAELDLSLLRLASSTSINGGFKISRDRNVVRVQRTGLGAVVPPGKNVALQLGLIKNPVQPASNVEVAIEIRSATQAVQVARKNYRIEF